MQPFLFRERSRLITAGLLLSLLPVLAVLAYLIWQTTREQTTGGMVFNIIILAIVGSSIVLLLTARLEVTYYQDRIRVHYFPFGKADYYYRDVASMSFHTINPLTEFGGWGLRKSRVYGKGYTTRGDRILCIRKTNGEVISVTVLNQHKVAEIISQIPDGERVN